MAFTASDYELTASELLKRVALSRPTLYRLLGTLQQSGFITSTGEPQRFRLGSSVAHLAHVWASRQDINYLAQPMLRRLWEVTGETVSLFITQEGKRLCVAEIPSVQPLSLRRGIGYQETLILGAGGRAILAFDDQPMNDIEELLLAADITLAEHHNRLAWIREHGYAVSRDELLVGATSVAAPFFGGGGRVEGAMCVYGPGARLNDEKVEEIARLLMRECELLSTALGFRRPVAVTANQ